MFELNSLKFTLSESKNEIDSDIKNDSAIINELICAICKKLIVKASLTNCGHNFCSICLNDIWLIGNKNCPQCETDLRIGEITFNLNLDEIIDYESRNLSNEVLSDYTYRIKLNDSSWKEKKKNFEKLKIGDYLDVRDKEMVWCVAEVLEIRGNFTGQDFLKNSIKVHYLSWHDCYDEVIPLFSPRLVKLGYFTMQKEIPQYKCEKSYDNLTASLLIYKKDLDSYQTFKRYSPPELKTCEEFYNYENSKISD